ncbi:MAG: MerR family transcriptional regulator [Pseudorhodobacter sp.]
MDKSPDAFRTISEVAELLDTPAHVLRFWESRFSQIKPVKRAGGRRYYRPSDVTLLSGIKQLLHVDGLTIRGVQKILREQGVKFVASLGPLSQERQPPVPEAPFEDVPEIPETAAEPPVQLFPDQPPPDYTGPHHAATAAQPGLQETVPRIADATTPPQQEPSQGEPADARQRDFWEDPSDDRAPLQTPAPEPAPRLRYVSSPSESQEAAAQEEVAALPESSQAPMEAAPETSIPVSEVPLRWLAADLRGLGPGSFRRGDPERAAALAAKLRSLRGKLAERGRIAHR